MQEAEEDLVARAVAGEAAAMNRLLMDHYDKLQARVDKKLPQDLRAAIAPEDLVQEALADAFRRIRSFRPEGRDAFYRWLTAIADNCVTDTIRAQRAAKRGGGRARLVAPARSSIAMLVDLLAVNSRTPSRSAGGQEAAAALQIALAGLRADYRDALSLRYLQGLPVAEAAARLGKTEAAVKKLCVRGLQALRTSLGAAASYLSQS